MKRVCYTLNKGEQAEYDPEFDESDIRCVMARIRQALSLTYHEKILRPGWSRYGLCHQDQRGEIVNADTLKTVVSSGCGAELLSLSDIQIRNKKTQKVTNISSLWVRFTPVTRISSRIEETSDDRY